MSKTANESVQVLVLLTLCKIIVRDICFTLEIKIKQKSEALNFNMSQIIKNYRREMRGSTSVQITPILLSAVFPSLMPLSKEEKRKTPLLDANKSSYQPLLLSPFCMVIKKQKKVEQPNKYSNSSVGFLKIEFIHNLMGSEKLAY